MSDDGSLRIGVGPALTRVSMTPQTGPTYETAAAGVSAWAPGAVLDANARVFGRGAIGIEARLQARLFSPASLPPVTVLGTHTVRSVQANASHLFIGLGLVAGRQLPPLGRQ
jgi:hypothetical protein